LVTGVKRFDSTGVGLKCHPATRAVFALYMPEYDRPKDKHMKERSTTQLRRLLKRGQTLVKPGSFNALSAMIIEKAGFPCCGVTG
jgi:hypothetical protein